MKIRWILIPVFSAVFMLFLAHTALAQGEPPAPYAGIKNPFPWGDAGAQAAGNTLYKQSCLGCHGITGDNLAVANFAKAEFSQDLKARPDFYFWVVSEGRLDKGMPPFKSSLSEQQRWQLLTFISTLASSTPAEGATPPPATGAPAGNIRLILPAEVEGGQPVTLKAAMLDDQDKPVARAGMKFFIKTELFTQGLMEIGSAVTGADGIASVEYTPRNMGDLNVVVQSGASRKEATVHVAGGVELTYRSEAGIHLPNVGPEDIIYPKSVLDLGQDESAPLPGFRLPGGALSWIFLLVATVFMIWFTYFRVVYQLFRIPVVSEIRDVNTRLLPTIGLILVTFVGLVLILKVLISPYSHLNLPLP